MFKMLIVKISKSTVLKPMLVNIVVVILVMIIILLIISIALPIIELSFLNKL